MSVCRGDPFNWWNNNRLKMIAKFLEGVIINIGFVDSLDYHRSGFDKMQVYIKFHHETCNIQIVDTYTYPLLTHALSLN